MKLYYLFKPLFEWNVDLMLPAAQFCSAKALELQLQSNFYEGLKAVSRAFAAHIRKSDSVKRCRKETPDAGNHILSFKEI